MIEPCRDRQARPLRLVLDTNVILDLLVWHDASVRGLAAALASGRAVALGGAACLEELRQVLQRPEFARPGCDVRELFAGFAGRCDTPSERCANDLPPLPRCRDASDQKFLQLARATRADLLVTRDKDLLRLARKSQRIPDFHIVTPQQAEARLS